MSHLSQALLDEFLNPDSAEPRVKDAISRTARELGLLRASQNERAVRAVAAIRSGASPEQVAKVLLWREFEQLCAHILRARGFEVRENITLTKPRVQVDILARSSAVGLAVDCKHWKREMGYSGLLRAVTAQSRRAAVLREKMPFLEPLLVVLVSLANESARYVGTGIVVPLHTLGDFVSNLDAYAQDTPRF
jgi:hypothetical protein